MQQVTPKQTFWKATGKRLFWDGIELGLNLLGFLGVLLPVLILLVVLFDFIGVGGS